MYYGEEPEPGESEDECYAALDTQRAYTRSSVERRRTVWEDIEAFEATRTRTLMQPKHRGLGPSVRPRAGAEAVVSFVAKPSGGGASEVGGRRAVVVAGDAEAGDEPWKAALRQELLRMRRGERCEVDAADGFVVDACLHAVRVERKLAPRPDGPWPAAGEVNAKRFAAPKRNGAKPAFGDAVEAKIVVVGAADARDDDALFAALDGADTRSLVLGRGDVAEGLETALLAMRVGEASVATAFGDFANDPNTPAAPPPEAEASGGVDDAAALLAAPRAGPPARVWLRAALRLDAVEAGAEDPAAAKTYGAELAARGRWRLAEAAWSRGARAAQRRLVDEDDGDARRSAAELLARLLLNVGLAAGKRPGGGKDEVRALTAAVECLGTLSLAHDPDSDDDAAPEEGFVDARAALLAVKARVRRAAARTRLGDAAAALADLDAADAGAAAALARDPADAAAKALARDAAVQRRSARDAAAKRRRADRVQFKAENLFKGDKPAYAPPPEEPPEAPPFELPTYDPDDPDAAKFAASFRPYVDELDRATKQHEKGELSSADFAKIIAKGPGG